MPSNTSNSREIRVFLSSTFRDMEAERNYLMTSVFPDIRRYCSERQVSFTEIDLRWGITEEESKQGRTVEICLDEINRCRKYPPFFIGFLGERYGWIPQQQDLAVWLNDNNDSPYASEIHGALAQGISVTELEMQYAFLNEEQPADHSRIFLRAAEKTHHLYQEALAHTSADHPVLESDFYDAANGKLASLKDKLRASKCLSIDGYTSIKEFGDAVKHYLIEAVDHLYPQDTLLSAADMQTRAHNNYAASRRKAYVPLTETRANVLADITTASNGEEAKQAIAITGLSGRGKSAFLADLESQLTNKGWIFSHYTGADGNRSLDSWLSRLIEALTATGTLISEIPSDRDGQWQAISTALLEVQAGLNTPIYLLVDAVNQFTEKDAFNTLSQLKLPESVVLIATTTQAIDDNSWLVHDLPALNPQNRQLAIDSFFSDFRKDLPKELIQKIAQHTAAAEPLFLRLLLEELRLHAKHETLTPLAKQLLDTQDASGLFASVLSAMNDDHQHSTHTELASQAVSLLGASRRGLHHEDLAKLLASDSDPKDPTDNQPRLPDFILSPLLAKLEAFCLRDDGRIYIMHDALLAVALRNSERLTESRLQLVSHFSDNTGHAVAERVHQYTALENTEKLVQTLGDLDATIALWEYEKVLFQSTLSQLGAGLHKKNKTCTDLAVYWGQKITSYCQLPKSIDNFCGWLLDNSYNNLLKDLLEALLKFREGKNNYKSLDFSTTLNNLAVLYENLGDLNKAESILNESLIIYKESLKTDDPYILRCLSNLANIYHKKGDLNKAEIILKNIIAIRESTLPIEKESLAISLNLLSNVYHGQNRFNEAEILDKRALFLKQEIFTSGHQQIGNSLNSLATTYYKQDRFKEAEETYTHALNSFLKKLPKEHPNIATCLNNIAELYDKTGRIKEAEKTYQQALDINLSALPNNHPIITESLSNLADFYKRQDNFYDSEACYSHALFLNQISLPVNDLNVAILSFSLSKLYYDQELLSKAKPLLYQALDIYKKILEKDHDYIVSSLNLLASIYEKQDDLTKSEKYYFELLELELENQENIAKKLNNIANKFFEKKQYRKSKEIYLTALNIFQKNISKNRSYIVIILNSLSYVYEKQDRLTEAKKLYIQAQELKKNDEDWGI